MAAMQVAIAPGGGGSLRAERDLECLPVDGEGVGVALSFDGQRVCLRASLIAAGGDGDGIVPDVFVKRV